MNINPHNYFLIFSLLKRLLFPLIIKASHLTATHYQGIVHFNINFRENTLLQNWGSRDRAFESRHSDYM